MFGLTPFLCPGHKTYANMTKRDSGPHLSKLSCSGAVVVAPCNQSERSLHFLNYSGEVKAELWLVAGGNGDSFAVGQL